MKRILLTAVMFSVIGTLAVAQALPAVDKITKVRNYHQATDTIATGGAIYDGGLKELKQNGFASIIDLRTPPEGTVEEQGLVESLGMNYTNLPVSGGNISVALVEKFSTLVESVPKPVLIHCASGNRVGAMWSLYQIQKGVPLEKAFAQGRASGMRQSVEQSIKSIGESICLQC